MRSPDEIKSALQKCYVDRSACDMCALSDGNVKKWRELMGEALTYIHELECIDKNRMLSVGELQSYLESDELNGGWVEFTTERQVFGNHLKLLQCFVDKIATKIGAISLFTFPTGFPSGAREWLYVNVRDYGKTWRVWKHKPTAEECASAPWMPLPEIPKEDKTDD